MIDGLRPPSQGLWEGLSLEERRRFVRHAESEWTLHRSRLAPAVGERVAALLAEGRLVLRAARLVAVAAVPDGVSAGLRTRGERQARLETFDWIISCSGVGRLRPDAMEPILAQMLADGSSGRIRSGAASTFLPITRPSTEWGTLGRAVCAGAAGGGPFLRECGGSRNRGTMRAPRASSHRHVTVGETRACGTC